VYLETTAAPKCKDTHGNITNMCTSRRPRRRSAKKRSKRTLDVLQNDRGGRSTKVHNKTLSALLLLGVHASSLYTPCDQAPTHSYACFCSHFYTYSYC